MEIGETVRFAIESGHRSTHEILARYPWDLETAIQILKEHGDRVEFLPEDPLPEWRAVRGGQGQVVLIVQFNETRSRRPHTAEGQS